MSEIRLAGNYIDYSWIYGAGSTYGHLQIVYVDGTGQTEIEAQEGISSGLFVFTYEPFQDHTNADNTPNYGDFFDKYDYSPKGFSPWFRSDQML